MQQLQAQIHDLQTQVAQEMNVNTGKKEQDQGKSIRFILDTGSNHSFIEEYNCLRKTISQERRVQTANGTFRSRKAVIVPMKTQKKRVTAEALIQDKLPRNILSVIPIINKLGAVMLDKYGAELIQPENNTKMRDKIHYFRHSQ